MGTFIATANDFIPLGDTITSFEATITVPSDPPPADQTLFWWIGLETQNSETLIQPILSWEGGHWVLFDAWFPASYAETTDTLGSSLGTEVSPGTTLTLKITELPNGSYEGVIPGYTSGIINTPPSNFTQLILALETYGVTAPNQLGEGVIFSDIQVQVKNAQGIVSNFTPTWTTVTDGEPGVHVTTSPTGVAFNTIDGLVPSYLLPSIPTIDTSAPDQENINLTKLIILGGQAQEGTTATLFDGTTKIESVSVGTNGLWAMEENNLSNGVHNFTVTDTNSHGISLSVPMEVTVTGVNSLHPVA